MILSSLRSLLLGVVLSGVVMANLHASPLTLQSPEPDAVIVGTMVPYSGYTNLSGYVMVNGLVVRVDQWGHFRGKVRAAIGENQIRFSVVDGDTGEVLELTRRVICLQHYSDLSGHWARHPVQMFATYIGLGGMNARGFFHPDHELQRWELMDWIARAYELPLRWPKTPRFKDVLPSDRFYNVVETVANRFNIDGSSDTEFSPDGFLSRADFARILIKVAQVQEFYSYTGWASDVSRRFWGASYIETAKQMGLLPPYWTEGDMFFPYRPVTRAEVVYSLTVLPEMQSRLAVLRPRVHTEDVNKIVRYEDPRYRVRQAKKVVKEVADDVAVVAADIVDASETAVDTAKKESADLSDRLVAKIVGIKDKYRAWHAERRLAQEQAAAEQAEREAAAQLALETAAREAAEAEALRKAEEEATLAIKVAAEPGAVSEEMPDVADDMVYTILSGDTLPKISKRFTGRYGNWQAIAEYNDIGVRRVQTPKGEQLRVTIIVGRTIKIPGRLLN